VILDANPDGRHARSRNSHALQTSRVVPSTETDVAASHALERWASRVADNPSETDDSGEA
jgi:hypothetical protein